MHSQSTDATAATIGRSIREMRKSYRLTQTQLGDLVGLSDKTVRDIERGTGSPSLKAVLSTLSALGLRLEVTDS